MEVKVCKNCRRLFQYIYGPELCPQCLKNLPKDEIEPIQQNENKFQIKPMVKEEEELYEKVKDFIMRNPKADISTIAEANDVSPKKLLDWIRQERLEFSDDSKDAWFECAVCGAKIKSGRLCNRCKNHS